MATSGSTDLATSRDEIITEALEYLKILAEGESPNANQLTSMGRTLNWLVKHIQQAHGGHLFGREKWYLFLKKNQHQYKFSDSTTDKFCRASVFKNTFTSATSASSGTTITVDDTTGMINGTTIGVEVTNNVMHWTTINGLPAGSVVTLTDALPADVAIDAQVYYYNSAATSGDREMPLLIINGYRTTKFTPSDGSKGTDIPLEAMALEDYEDLSIKTSDGAVNQYFYDRQRLDGEFFIWPETSDETTYLSLWVQRPIEDFDAANDEPDYPQEWFLTLAYNLAKYSLVKYAPDQATAQFILGLADETLRDSLASDTELWLQFRPNERGL